MRPPQKVWVISDDKGSWYRGNMKSGLPICDGTRNEAMEMYDREIEVDFPSGLPDGWAKEEA